MEQSRYDALRKEIVAQYGRMRLTGLLDKWAGERAKDRVMNGVSRTADDADDWNGTIHATTRCIALALQIALKPVRCDNAEQREAVARLVTDVLPCLSPDGRVSMARLTCDMEGRVEVFLCIVPAVYAQPLGHKMEWSPICK
jgi:hypothetical protein